MSKFWKNLANYAALAVLWISFLIALWILWIRLNDGLGIEKTKYLVGLFVLVLMTVGGVILLRKKQPKFLRQPKFYLFLTVGAVVVGVILRLGFLHFYGEYMPKGEGTDTGVHWYMAQEILETGKIQDEFLGNYEAFFTQLTSYTLLVAVSMWFVGVNYLAILLPNILFDLVAAGAIYVLLRKWKDEKVAAWGVVLAMLNPLSICFCAEGLALSVVNMFVALGLLLIYFLWIFLQQNTYGKFWLTAAAIGLVLACGNAFRPVFSVLIIAVLGLLVLDLLMKKVDWKHALKTGGGFVIMLVVFAGVGLGWDGIYRLVNPYYQTERHSMLGWNFFVGANFETEGRWSPEDWNLMAPKLAVDEETETQTQTPAEINSEFMTDGIQRYAAMSPVRILLHLMNKSRILFGRNEITIIRNMEEQFTNVWGNEWWYGLACVLNLLMLTVFAVLTTGYFGGAVRTRKVDLYGVFLALSFCGLFASSLLVEVMSRYVVIFIVPLVIFSACVIPKLTIKIMTMRVKRLE